MYGVLQKQNKMLKDYVKALQNQNSSRNKEKDILIQEIEMLTKENQNLRNQLDQLLTQPTTQHHSPNINQYGGQTGGCKDRQEGTGNAATDMAEEVSRLNKELQDMQSKIQASEHSAKVREAQTLEIQILTTENTQLRQRIEQLEAQLETLRGENEKHGLVLAAEKQQADDIHSQNEIKRKQEIVNLKEEFQRELQVQKEELTRELTSKHQGIKQAQENIIKELQTKVKELQSKLYKVQVGSTAEMRQLKTFKAEAEDKLTQMQIDKQNLIHRVQEMQNQITKNSQLLKAKSEDGRKKHTAEDTLQGTKEKAMKNKTGWGNRTQESSATQVEEQFLKKCDRTTEELSTIQLKYKKEIEQLKHKLAETENKSGGNPGDKDTPGRPGQRGKESEGLKKVIMELTENSKNLLDRLKYFQEPENQQPDERNGQYHKDINENTDQIRSLKSQLLQVTTDFKKAEAENKQMKDQLNSKSLDASRVKESSYLNQSNLRKNYQQTPMEEKRYMRSSGDLNSQRIPLYTSHIQRGPERLEENEDYSKLMRNNKYRSPTEKYNRNMGPVEDSRSSKGPNKERWQNLQRKIKELREENCYLKQTLSS